jgi:hypothetical protein
VERRAVTGELSGRRGVATLVRSFPVAVAFPFIVTTESVLLGAADEKLTAFLELESAVKLD